MSKKKKKQKVILPYTHNEQGVLVKRCCASCTHKDLTQMRSKRRCKIRECDVKSCNVCSLWQMSKQVRLAGQGMGMIKRKEYLMYLMEQRMEEQRQRDDGIKVRERKVETIRKIFEKDSKSSIYIIH